MGSSVALAQLRARRARAGEHAMDAEQSDVSASRGGFRAVCLFGRGRGRTVTAVGLTVATIALDALEVISPATGTDTPPRNPPRLAETSLCSASIAMLTCRAPSGAQLS